MMFDSPFSLNTIGGSGNANDLASLSYEVSQESKPLQLICGNYTPLETVRTCISLDQSIEGGHQPQI